MSDALRTLGLANDATAADVRRARRELAKEHHPDAGGDAERMRTINEAAGSALRALAEVASKPQHAERPDAPGDARSQEADRRRSDVDDGGVQRDIPSFTVEALPVETFEALLVVTTWIGELIDDDPPYRLDVLMHANELLDDPCWCRLELVPDAGASTVSISVGAYDAHRTPSITVVRDVWVAQLNRYDWS